jgi:hypothetical protein
MGTREAKQLFGDLLRLIEYVVEDLQLRVEDEEEADRRLIEDRPQRLLVRAEGLGRA